MVLRTPRADNTMRILYVKDEDAPRGHSTPRMMQDEGTRLGSEETRRCPWKPPGAEDTKRRHKTDGWLLHGNWDEDAKRTPNAEDTKNQRTTMRDGPDPASTVDRRPLKTHPLVGTRLPPNRPPPGPGLEPRRLWRAVAVMLVGRYLPGRLLM